MAITRVQSKTGNSAGSSVATLAVTFTGTPVAGNIIVAVAAYLGSASEPGCPCTFSATGVTWLGVLPAAQGASSTHCAMAIGRVQASPGSTVTATTLQSGGFAMVIAEYSGVGLSFDSFGTGTNSSTSISASGTTTTTGSNQLWVCGVSHRATSGGTFSSPGNGFAIVGQDKSGLGTTSDRSACLLEKIVSATGTATATVSVSPTGVWIAELLTLDQAVAGSMLFLPDLSGT